MMRFEAPPSFDFAAPGRILFGCGRLKELPGLLRAHGLRVLLVTGASGSRHTELHRLLGEINAEVAVWPVKHEPSIQIVDNGAAMAREFAAEVVVGFGGGSAIDAARAIAGLANNPGSALDYVEVVGKGAVLTRPALPWFAVPTTAGTGAEVTKNAVLSVPEQQVKVSLRSPLLFATAALVDPKLTLPLPPALTATTGMDALTQLIEAYVSTRSTPWTDALCADALPRMAWALPEAFEKPASLAARTAVSYGSLCSGLANAGFGVVHGFAAPIGGMFAAPHGAICAALLAPVYEANVAALRRAKKTGPLERYTHVARWLTSSTGATIEDGAAWIRRLIARLEIASLRSQGIKENDVAVIAQRAARASSTKGNPVVLEQEELESTLRAALS